MLVQQRAAPTLICASKSQVRKHMSADRDVLPEYSHTPPCGGMVWYGTDLGTTASVELNFEYNDRRNKIIPKEVQAKLELN